MRWIFHLVRADAPSYIEDGRYAPPSLRDEGFIHGSYKDALAASAGLHFPAGVPLRIVAIDPRRLDVPIEVADTPRGPMPHVVGSIPVDAMRVLDLAAMDGLADELTGTRIALVGFEGMTLLDLVGPLDALSRIASMGFDGTTSCEVVALTRPDASSEATSLERVVDDGQLVTAGGDTSGVELGLHLVGRLAGEEARRRIAARLPR